MTDQKLEQCPSCEYILIERSTYCPHCGAQLTYVWWKKAGAWLLLILIGYGLIKCNFTIMEGLDQF